MVEAVKNLPAAQGPRFDPRSGRSSGEGNGNLPQYSCLENPWIEKRGGSQSMGSQDRIERLTLSPLVIYILSSSSFPPQCLIYQSHFPGICLVSLTENSIPFFLSVYSSLLSFTSQHSVLKILNIQQMLAE